MIEELAEFPLSEQVLEKVGKFIKRTYQSTHLVKTVKEMEEKYKQNVFDDLSQQEEFDWEGLMRYIDDNLLCRISSVFLLPDKEVREASRKQVYIRAYSSAKANTVASQRQVDRFMDEVLLQVRNFLSEKQEPFDRMPFHEVTDQVCVRLDDLGEDIKTGIEQQTKELVRHYKNLHESLKYQNSFRKLVDHTKLPQPIDSLFNYRDPKVGFYGREKEISFLDQFLDCEKPVLFTAVTGPAGSGKSKFVYEYVKNLAGNPNWKCLFIQNRTILNKFIGLYEWEYPVNLLVVIDYAGDYADLIGEWLVLLKTGQCPPKMRIVLLEREGIGKNKNDNDIQEKNLVYPMWYERLLTAHSNDDIRSMLYTTGKEIMFLELSTLSDDAFKYIMADYAEGKGKVLSEHEKEEILEYCKKIERNEQGVCRPRPLILLFIVDAWVHEDKYHRWNIQELLLKIINRYKKHWKTTLCEGDKNVFAALERLIIYATATGGWEIADQLPEFLQKDLVTVKEFCGTPEKLNQLFRSVNEKFEWDYILSPLEPDLIGELFVLEYLQNTFELENMVEAFNTNRKYILFLFRSIVDYADVEKYSDLFDNGLKKLLNESLIIERPELYAWLIITLTDKQNEEKAKVTLEYLEELALHSQYAGNEEIVLTYARALANIGMAFYLQQNFIMAEESFAKAHRMGDRNGSINLSYMIRRRQTKSHSPNEVKELLLPVLNDNNSLAIMNMALYLAEYENDWHGADDLIFTAVATGDFSEVIGWWSGLDDLEGLLVMTWLERNKICIPYHTLKGEKTLELLRGQYSYIPDWITQIRKEESLV